MEELRTPCEHRGQPGVMQSPVPVPDDEVTINICQECRRFWLERRGWLMSRRETAQVLKAVALPGITDILVR